MVSPVYVWEQTLYYFNGLFINFNIQLRVNLLLSVGCFSMSVKRDLFSQKINIDTTTS